MYMMLQIGRTIDIYIERLGINGEGVGYLDGYTVFVEGALPGEKVRAQLYEQRKSYGRANVIELLTDSPHRVTPPCPLFGQCGGCQLMHLEYHQQLVIKRQRVVDAIERVGKLFDIDVLPCEASPSSLAYRNKIQLPCAPGRETIHLGLYAQNTHDLIEIERCYIHSELGEKAFQQIQQILKNSPLVPYDPRTREGELRHVLIKTAVHTQQVLVILVTKSADLPFLSVIAQKMIDAIPQIQGVVQNINRSTGNVILSQDYRVLAGKEAVEEKILGLTFKVSPASFFQVNPSQAEKLYQKALELASLTKEETVLDAYCGVGTLSLILAKEAKEVIGVECVAKAIADAKENAEINGIANIQFHCALAEEFISDVKNIDVAILNPPRKGCDKALLERLVVLRPQRIVYISCDPATLARDLAFLSGQGYRIDLVQPFDMFPQTAHVECIVRLTVFL